MNTDKIKQKARIINGIKKITSITTNVCDDNNNNVNNNILLAYIVMVKHRFVSFNCFVNWKMNTICLRTQIY